MSFTPKVMFLFLVYITTKADDGQLYYPSEDGGIAKIMNNSKLVQVTPPNQSLSDIQTSSVYEEYVDKIISLGISKLTLAINNVLMVNSEKVAHDHIVFAPVGIAAALALVFLGSNGKTFQELSDVMGLATGIVDLQKKTQMVHEQFGRILSKLETNSGFTLGHQVNVASAIFVQNNFPIRPVFKESSLEIYRSEILNVDFHSSSQTAQNSINSWVSQRTNGRIKQILEAPPLDSTKVIIASAVYFKAAWESPFFDGSTRRRPFYINGRKSSTIVEVEMMANGGDFPYFKDQTLNCEIMGFPYKGNSSTMYVIMPFDSDRLKLIELERNLIPSELNRLAESTKYTDSVILLPKMKIESTVDLKDSLQALGVKSLFDPAEANLALLSAMSDFHLTSKFEGDVKSQLSNCTRDLWKLNTNVTSCNETYGNASKTVVFKRIGNKIGRKNVRRALKEDTLDNIRTLINQQSIHNNYQNPGLYADNVLHKVFMEITETGTEAAAATSIALSRTGHQVTFRVDVPFLFFIRHQATKTILFWGSVDIPTPRFKANSNV